MAMRGHTAGNPRRGTTTARSRARNNAQYPLRCASRLHRPRHRWPGPLQRGQGRSAATAGSPPGHRPASGERQQPEYGARIPCQRAGAMKSSRWKTSIILPAHCSGTGWARRAQAMMSTSCSSRNDSNHVISSSFQPAPCASRNPPIIMSASRVPRCQARNLRRLRRVSLSIGSNSNWPVAHFELRGRLG